MQEHGGELIIPFSGVFEQKLADMPDDEAAVYCKENQLQRRVSIHQQFFFGRIFGITLCTWRDEFMICKMV